MVYRKTYQRDIPFDSSERGEVLLAAANLAVEQDEVSFGVFVPDSAPTFAVEQVSVRDDCDVLTLDIRPFAGARGDILRSLLEAEERRARENSGASPILRFGMRRSGTRLDGFCVSFAPAVPAGALRG